MSVVRIAGWAESTDGPADLEDRLPGRWDPRRALPAPLRPLVAAIAQAARQAGWWGGQPLDGGLVLGTDLQPLEPAVRLARGLAGGRADVRPADFLHALPSSAAACVGLTLGLLSYQATLTAGGLSGFRAVAHAADQLTLGGHARMVAAALTVVEPAARGALQGAGLPAGDVPLTLAAAWCLERDDPTAAGPRLVGWDRLDAGRPTAAALGELVPELRWLAAPSLLAARRLGAGRVTHTSRWPAASETLALSEAG